MENRLKTWREGEGLSAEGAAKSVGVSLPTWSRWERGRRRIPAERVPIVSTATGIPAHELRPDVFEPSREPAQ